MLVPSNFPVVGSVDVDRPIYDDKVPNECLLSLLPKVDVDEFDEFAPTTWSREAYAKSFEKFFYAEPCDFEKRYPDLCAFADKCLRIHYSYLQDTRVIHMTATEKNLESTPAYPKFNFYDTEAEYLEENGWGPYISEFSRIFNGAKPKVLWYLFLKKEVLKREKIEQNDIRQILCADPIYARIGACFEAHQNNLMKQHTETGSGQCGWSPFDGGFRRRMLRLNSKPGHFIEFDWTRFDGTIPTALFRRIKQIRWSFINKQHREKYRHMYAWYVHNLLNRYVLLPSGEITKHDRGNPSGQISTTMDNNMVNYWLQAFEFAYLYGPDYELFCEYDTLIYGDDRLTRTPILDPDYKRKVVQMYKDVFGMWVKPEKVKVSNSLVGLSFCGFTINENFDPIPTQPFKLMAGLLKPAATVPDVDALHGKLLSYQVLMHFCDDFHPFKCYIERCLNVTKRYVGDRLPARFTDEQLDRLWRGGPRAVANGNCQAS